MNARESSGCWLCVPGSKGLRIPSTAEEVFAEIKRPARALAGERKKRFDLESLIQLSVSQKCGSGYGQTAMSKLTRASTPVAEN